MRTAPFHLTLAAWLLLSSLVLSEEAIRVSAYLTRLPADDPRVAYMPGFFTSVGKERAARFMALGPAPVSPQRMDLAAKIFERPLWVSDFDRNPAAPAELERFKEQGWKSVHALDQKETATFASTYVPWSNERLQRTFRGNLKKLREEIEAGKRHLLVYGMDNFVPETEFPTPNAELARAVFEMDGGTNIHATISTENLDSADLFVVEHHSGAVGFFTDRVQDIFVDVQRGPHLVKITTNRRPWVEVVEFELPLSISNARIYIDTFSPRTGVVKRGTPLSTKVHHRNGRWVYTCRVRNTGLMIIRASAGKRPPALVYPARILPPLAYQLLPGTIPPTNAPPQRLRPYLFTHGVGITANWVDRAIAEVDPAKAPRDKSSLWIQTGTKENRGRIWLAFNLRHGYRASAWVYAPPRSPSAKGATVPFDLELAGHRARIAIPTGKWSRLLIPVEPLLRANDIRKHQTGMFHLKIGLPEPDTRIEIAGLQTIYDPAAEESEK